MQKKELERLRIYSKLEGLFGWLKRPQTLQKAKLNGFLELVGCLSHLELVLVASFLQD